MNKQKKIMIYKRKKFKKKRRESMYKTVSIIGGDLRLVNLINLLAKDDFLVYTYGLENAEELVERENVKKCASIAELVGSSEIIIGPVPMTNDSVNLSAPFSEEKISIEELITEMSNKNKMFLAGKLSDKTIQSLQEGNINYTSIDGVLYDEDRTTLLTFPAGRTGGYIVPTQTERIAANAFAQTGLSVIDIRDCGTLLIEDDRAAQLVRCEQ